MSKLSYEDKINLYNDRKRMSLHSVALKYNVNDSRTKYLVRLIDKHGIDILKKVKKKKYSSIEKEKAINRVLTNGESIWSVAIDMGLLSWC